MGVVDSHPPHSRINGYAVLVLSLLTLGLMAGFVWFVMHFPEVWAAQWRWMLPMGIAFSLYPLGRFVLPLIWKGHTALRAHQREEELHRRRVAELESIEQLLINAKTEGFHVEYSNANTGQSVKITNPTIGRVTAIREVKDEQLALPSPSEATRPLPTVETFYEMIPYNSLQTGMGVELVSGKPVLASIPKSVHFKLIGGSGQGKSCVAGAILDIATTTNDPDHLRIGLLDLEHNTSRLFEDLPHIAEIGPRRIRLVGRDPDEVAQKLKLLQWELTRRAQLGEEYCREHEPILLVYVEEMLALKYEVVDEKLKKEMLAAINILGVRARKYGIFLLVCMQIDYSDKSTREAMAQFRTRGGFAIDPDAARASGFFDTQLVKQNYQVSRPGQYILEKPAYSGLLLSPDYDVASKLAATTRATTKPTTEMRVAHYEDAPSFASVVASKSPTTGALDGRLAPLTEQEWRIIEKWRSGSMGLKAIIASEFTNGKGEPLVGGDLFTQKAKEIQVLIARFLPERGEA